MGSAIASIKIEIERESGDLDGYQFWASANIQPPLQLSEKRIEFGVCAVHDKYVREWMI